MSHQFNSSTWRQGLLDAPQRFWAATGETRAKTTAKAKNAAIILMVTTHDLRGIPRYSFQPAWLAIELLAASAHRALSTRFSTASGLFKEPRSKLMGIAASRLQASSWRQEK